MASQLQNWARNFTYGAARVHWPATVEEVQELVSRSRRVKALGTRHSFNDIADTPEDLVSLERLNRVVSLDGERLQVTVEGGIPYGRLCGWLHEQGYALHNLASLPHISVAGACATATHGSGDGNGNLATAVSAMEIVMSDGSLITLSREKDRERFEGAVVGLGALGVVTKVTLDVHPTFQLRQEVYEGLALEGLEPCFDAVTSSAYSVSLFTDWRTSSVNQVWVKRRIEDGLGSELAPEFFGAKLASDHRHPIPGSSAENCTAQMGIPGAWHDRLPHFRMDFTPSSGEELQAEYLVPRQHAFAALMAINEMREQIAPYIHISEVRTIAADNLWMSPCYGQPCVGIHFTWKKDWESMQRLLPQIDARFEPFEARPHWGKLFTMRPEQVQPLFERLPDFRRLAGEFDPEGKFRNRYLDAYVFGGA